MRMQVEEVKTTPPWKKAMAGMLVVLAIAALVWGGYRAWLAFSVPAMPQTVEEVEGLLDDPRYQNMSAQQRRPYIEHVNEMLGSLGSDDRSRLRESFQGRDDDTVRQAQMDMFFTLMRGAHTTIANAQTPEQQDQVIDGIIAYADAEQARAERQRESGEEGLRPSREGWDEEGGDGDGGQNGRAGGERMMADFLDSGDPQVMGIMSEMFKLIEERRAERGLPSMIGG